jgi:hydrogenase large subunit
MATTITRPTEGTTTPGSTLTEMVWDPITRIVGSLGPYTEIDFSKRTVAECYSTSSIFRGYSIFMKGKDPRDAHFITSRICGGRVPPTPRESGEDAAWEGLIGDELVA